MAMLFRRKAIVPVWIVVLGLFALFGPPMTTSTSVLVLLFWGVALSIMLVLWKEPALSISEILRDAGASHREVARAASSRSASAREDSQ